MYLLLSAFRRAIGNEFFKQPPPSWTYTETCRTRAATYNHGMNMSENQVFESALSLPQSDRADLAFRLLQTLGDFDEEITASEFGIELHRRIDVYRRGELNGFTMDETREIVRQRLMKG